MCKVNTLYKVIRKVKPLIYRSRYRDCNKILLRSMGRHEKSTSPLSREILPFFSLIKPRPLNRHDARTWNHPRKSSLPPPAHSPSSESRPNDLEREKQQVPFFTVIFWTMQFVRILFLLIS